MKLKLVSLLALAAVLLAAAGGSIAYFTVTGASANVITAGNIKMELHDGASRAVAFSQESLSTLMPGNTVGKTVYVENTGDNAFYTRIRINCSAQSPTGSALNPDNITFNINTANWQPGPGGWYYCSDVVEKGVQTLPLFTEVSLLPETGNEYMDADVSIRIIAQAVQQDNNGETVWQAAGWPDE